MKRKRRKRRCKKGVPLTDITGKPVTVLPPAYALGIDPRITAMPTAGARRKPR